MKKRKGSAGNDIYFCISSVWFWIIDWFKFINTKKLPRWVICFVSNGNYMACYFMVDDMWLKIILLIPLLLACGIVQALPPVVASDTLITLPAEPSAEPTEAQTLTGVVCNSGGLNVRTDAGTDNEILATLPDGTPVTMTGQTQVIVVIPWLEITSPLHGWVFSRYICER